MPIASVYVSLVQQIVFLRFAASTGAVDKHKQAISCVLIAISTSARSRFLTVVPSLYRM